MDQFFLIKNMHMKSTLKKYQYFMFSSVLHLGLLVLVFFSSKNNFEFSNINFNTNASNGINLAKVSVLQEKGAIKKQTQKEENLGESKDESHVKSLIEDQSLLKYKPPKYPKVAILNKQEGEVIVRLLVEKNGEIKKIVIYKSSNYPLLDNAVLDVAKSWNIKRSLKEISWVQVSINFIIE